MITKEHYIIAFCAGLSFLLIAAAIAVIKRLKPKPLHMDDLEGHDFEYHCARLLKNVGFYHIRVTKGSGDFGADILAYRDDVSYAIQCKRYDNPVGVSAVQQVYAAKDYYDCMVGAVMTNSYYTEPAIKMARKLRVLLWDRDILLEMRA